MDLTAIFLTGPGRIRSGWRALIYLGLTSGFAVLAIRSLRAAAERLDLGAPGPASRSEAILLYLALVAVSLLTAYLMLRFVERRPFDTLGYSLHVRAWVELGQGAATGTVLVGVLFVALWVPGWIEVGDGGAEGGAILRMSGLYAALFTLAAALEELLARGYVLQVLIQGTGRVAAVGITSVVFGLSHLWNPHTTALGTLNTILAGIWLAAAYLKTRSLWLPTSLHTAWNFCLGFVFGFPVSGIEMEGSMLRSSGTGPVWITGGAYGPEAGILASLLLTIATIGLIRSRRVRPGEGSTALWEGSAHGGGSPARRTGEASPGNGCRKR